MIGSDTPLEAILKAFVLGGANRILAKVLAPNDNSKNQVYLAGSFDILNLLPAQPLVARTVGAHKKTILEAQLKLNWLGPSGNYHPAPHAKLILYPQYPEVRLSGFLKGCIEAPSDQMGTTRVAGRLLLFGIREDGEILAWAGSPSSGAKIDFDAMCSKGQIEQSGSLFRVPLPDTGSGGDRTALLQQLRRIHLLGWIASKRLDGTGKQIDCIARNCGGLTLEAELGIRPNGFSEPDFQGWEIKQHSVRSFQGGYGGAITLMTPEPTGGVYAKSGVREFVRMFGYADRRGRADRRNFGGIHKAFTVCERTGLTLTLTGYNPEENRITEADGGIALLDAKGREAASWPYSGLITHWNRKHARAAYVPSMKRESPNKQYRFGPTVRLGEGTDFQHFLSALAQGFVYYDPGIKVEGWSTDNPTTKRRSQFRIGSRELGRLYSALSSVQVSAEDPIQEP